MFERLVGGKPDHPMANMRKARELVAGLADTASLKALEQSVSWLGSISDAKEFKLNHRFDLVALIDREAKSHQFRLPSPSTGDSPANGSSSIPDCMENPAPRKSFSRR